MSLAVGADRDRPAGAVVECTFRGRFRADGRALRSGPGDGLGRSLGVSPRRFDEPTTRPRAKPPPATRTLMTLPQ